MAYPITDSVQRRHYDQHLSSGGEPQADVSMNEADYTMALGAAGSDYAAVNQQNSVSGVGTQASHTTHTTADASVASSTTHTANTAYSEADGGTVDGSPHKGGSGFLKVLIPLIGLLLLGWLGLKMLGGKTEETDAAATATDTAAAASTAAADGVSADAIGGEVTGFFSDATESLNGISDAESANAALPKLKELGGNLDGIKGNLDKVPEAARGPVAGIIGKGMESFSPIVEKVLALPGVGDVLKPVLEPMLETLKGMAG